MNHPGQRSHQVDRAKTDLGAEANPAVPLAVRVLYLDFDGVIMDSMKLKLEAYAYALEKHSFTKDSIERIQRRLSGLSRQHILPAMYRELSGNIMSDRDYEEALERFTRFDESSRERMQFKPGTLEFLNTVVGRLPMAIVTGTPQEVIDRTVERFGLGRYFTEICGTPGDKPFHLRRLMNTHQVQPQDCAFVGDAIGDQQAARDTAMAFVAVDEGDDPFAPDYVHVKVRRLDQLLSILKISEPLQ